MMQVSDILQTVAEVSIAFAGFTSVVAVLGRRASGEWAEIDRFRLSQMLASSIFAVHFSLLPPILTHLHVPESASWSSSSALLAVYLILQVTQIHRGVRRLPIAERTQIMVARNKRMQRTPQPVIKFACANLPPVYLAADAWR